MLQNLIQKLSSTDFKVTNSIIKDKNMIFYYNMQNKLKYTSLKMKLSTILNAYFKHFGCLISEPVINVTPKKLNIHIFYYKKDVVSQKFINQKYQQIYSNHESKLLSELVRLNGKILSYSRIKYLLLNKYKILSPVTYIFNKKVINSISSITPNSILFKKIDDNLFNLNLFNYRLSDNKDLTKSSDSNDYIHCNNDLRTYLTGMKLKISGRLAKQKVVPKRTVKTAYKGGISENKYNIVESSTFTHKNKKDAFSIRICLSHGKIS